MEDKMKAISGAHHINSIIDIYLKFGVLKLAQSNGKFEVKSQDDYVNIFKMTLDDVKEKFPNEYEAVLSHEHRVFTFDQMIDMFREGMQLHAYLCRTNQLFKYHCLDEDDYKEGSKYRDRYDNHKEITEFVDEKPKYNVW